MSIDLHLHTTASDGLLTPEELVSLAVRRGVRIISITDHDTIDAIARAEMAAKDFSIEIFPGVEINTDVGDSEIHILGYLFEDEELLENKLAALRRERLKRGEAMVGRLRDLGLDVSFDRILAVAGGASLGRPHVARVMVEQGYVSTIREAFDKYLAKGGPAYIPRAKFSPVEATRLISEARGIPVIAHPGKIRDQSLLDELVQHDVKGLEVYYGDHSPLQVTHYEAYARKNGLLMTGGSDFHGPESAHSSLGTVRVPLRCVDEMRRYKLVA